MLIKTEWNAAGTMRSRWQSGVAVAAMAVMMAACSISPEPFTDEENRSRAALDVAALFTNQEKVERTISLEEAVARALKYNLDYRLKLLEKAVADDEADLSHYSLLPALTADAGYNSRTHPDGTRATPGAEPSITTEEEIGTADIQIAWNVLDFGISYIRAHQQADLALMTEERRRQVIHNIVKDVRAAFWRVVAAERVMDKLEPLLGRVKGALNASDRLRAEGLGSPVDTLNYQKALLETLAQLEATKRELLQARTNLAVLMNIHPGDPYTLAVDPDQLGELPAFHIPLADMELTALAQRTELRSEAYQTRIYARESKIAIMQMLPGINLAAGAHHSDDSYLLYNYWGTMGVSLAWNLVNAIKGPKALELAERQEELSNIRRLALSMAVISQVHVADLRYQAAVNRYEYTDKLSQVENQLRSQYRAARLANQGGELGEIQAEVRALLAQLNRDMAFANVQETYGGLFATMGIDPLPHTIAGHSVDEVASALKISFDQWQEGGFVPAAGDEADPDPDPDGE